MLAFLRFGIVDVFGLIKNTYFAKIPLMLAQYCFYREALTCRSLGERRKQTYQVEWASRPCFDGRDARATRWLR